jgi:hypothetical protein
METQTTELPAVAASKETPRLEANHTVSALAAAGDFLRDFWPRLVAISAAILAPCFWHPRIEAGDLPSHTYNAWLAHLISTGQIPGLVLARQWNNVLFDLMLSGLGNLVGLGAAEKIAAAVAVLIFFWGAFALMCAFARPSSAQHIPWFVLPCLAIFAYGYTFEMGFMNYYLSLGFAFFALALVVGGRGLEKALSLFLAPLIWLAHPLGLALLLGVGAYILLARRLPLIYQLVLVAAAAALIAGVRFYMERHYDVSWRSGPRIIADGTDQLLTYGPHYSLLVPLLGVFLWAVVVVDVVRRPRGSGWWSAGLLPLQLYALALLAAVLLPSTVQLPQYAAPLGLLTERLTSVSAILLCSLAGLARPRKWHLAGFAAIAAIFFFFLYRDTATLNRMENQAENYVRAIPPGERILTTIWRGPGTRIFTSHIVDRACIAQCFSYGNYEPSSQQFRVRALPGNPIVLADAENASASSAGEYVVQPRDLPLFEIYQCDLNLTELCMRELTAGEKNGAVGVHPTR